MLTLLMLIPNDHAPHKKLQSFQITYHSVIGAINIKILLKINPIVLIVPRKVENVDIVLDHYLKNSTAVLMLIFAMPAPPNGTIIYKNRQEVVKYHSRVLWKQKTFYQIIKICVIPSTFLMKIKKI